MTFGYPLFLNEGRVIVNYCLFNNKTHSLQMTANTGPLWRKKGFLP